VRGEIHLVRIITMPTKAIDAMTIVKSSTKSIFESFCLVTTKMGYFSFSPFFANVSKSKCA
jgi:hypothetical protein